MLVMHKILHNYKIIYKNIQSALELPFCTIVKTTFQRICLFKLCEVMKTIIQDRTCIISTNNPLIAEQLADQVLYLREGTIFECGTHMDLMEKRESYYRFYHNFTITS